MKKKNEVEKICYVVGKWNGGGVESVVMNYYKNIDRKKYQIDFLCDSDSTNIPYDDIKKMGGEVILIPPYQKVFKYQKFLTNLFKEKKYNIVHSHINALSIFPLRAAKKAGVPIRIAHSHSTTSKAEFKRNLLKNILKPFSKIYATDYFCCSELAGRWLFGDKTYDDNKVFLLNNAIDVDKFKYDKNIRNQKRTELGIDDETLVLGHIGRFVNVKNHTFIIDIFNEIKNNNDNSCLILAGQGPLMEEIKQKVSELNLENKVKFLGQISDTNKLYQALDVFLLPSLYEGLPVVGVEAQVSGLLCEFSDTITCETKILDTTRFNSLNLSAKEWADIILEDLKDYKRQNVVDKITKKNFNIKTEAKKLEEKYEELLNGVEEHE